MHRTAIFAAVAIGSACQAPAPAGETSSAVGNGAATVRVADGTTKVRPRDTPPSAVDAAISAARNEYEAFQIVVHNDGATPLRLASYAWVRPLTAASGASIPPEAVRVFAEVMYDVTMQSGPDGATGKWPDALVPDVDDIREQKRNAFTKWWSAAPGENGVIYVEVHVPDDAVLPAGDYASALNLAFSDGSARTVNVKLTVWDFRLPSTSSLPTAFGMWIDQVCRAMKGETWCADYTDQMESGLPYARFMLDHRVTVKFIASGPDGIGGACDLSADPPRCDWSRFDEKYGPLLDGTDPALHLKGARATTAQFSWSNRGFGDPNAAQQHRAWARHFREKGWFDRTFDYTCDEPPATCAWTDIPGRASIVHAGDPSFRTLVTTSIAEASRTDPNTGRPYTSDIDVIVPVLNFMHDKGGSDQRATYAPYSSRAGTNRRLWMYQSCMSHGCGDGTNWDAYWTGWNADYTIDASGLKNRAMEWMSFLYDVDGELYWDTTYSLSTAFTNQSGFGGSGDGNLLYPGTPALIGGTDGIPLASLRLKLLREGMEDYEYLRLVAAKDPAFARSVAQGLFPAPSTYGAKPTTAQLYAARARLAERIVQLYGGTAPSPSPAPGPAPAQGGSGSTRPAYAAPVHGGVTVDGNLGELAGVPAIAVDLASAGSDSAAMARLAYDAVNLYAAFSVTDRALVVSQGGRDGEVWNGDSVELMIDTSNGAAATLGPTHYHLLVNASGDLADERGAGGSWDRSWTSNASYRVVRTAAGYDVALALPWASIGVVPCPGTQIGIDLAVNDVDAAGQLPKAADWARINPFAQPARWGTVTLGEATAGNVYLVQRARSAIAVDGNLAEFVAASRVDLSSAASAAGSDNAATARLLWDDRALYAAFDVTDAALLANQGGADGEVWNGDAVELMLHVGPRADALGPSDFHVLVSFRGDVTDERGSAAGWQRSWNLSVRPAVATRPGGYTVEMAIPWADLGLATPSAGTTFGIDLANDDLDAAGGWPKAFDAAGLNPFAQPARWSWARLAGTACGG